MRLTENQIRSIIRSELTHADGDERLDELLGGAFKALKAGLALVFKGLGAVTSAAFGTAESTYDPSKYKVSYASSDSNKSPETLSPKTDAYDQVYALGRVLWHIDASIELSVQSMGYGVESLKSLEFPVEPDDEIFGETLKAATENIATGAGYLKAYLSKAKSSKVSEIGASIEPGETLTGTLTNMAKAVTELESLNPVSDWETIIKSDAVTKVLATEGEPSENMKNLINEIKGDSMQNIGKIGDLKGLIDEANKIAVQAEQVMDVAAEEEGAKPEDSELLDHHIRDLRLLIREMIS